MSASAWRSSGFGAVCVDTEQRTSAAHIYAIGDVTDQLNLTPVATAEGHALADRLFGPGPRQWAFDKVATAVFFSPPLATVGLTEAEAAMRGPADIYVTRFTPMRHTLSGRPARTMMKLVVDQQTQVVLGAHMLGEDAPEIIQGLSIAINCGATKADFDRTRRHSPDRGGRVRHAADPHPRRRGAARAGTGRAIAARCGDGGGGDGGRGDGARLLRPPLHRPRRAR